MWQLQPQKPQNVGAMLPKVTFGAVMFLVGILLYFRKFIQKILQKYFAIKQSRPQHQQNNLQFSYIYHLSIIILILPELNWNMFDLSIWLISYVGIGLIRKAIYIIKIQKSILLNDYSYNHLIIQMLSSSKIFGIWILLFSLAYFFGLQFMFLGVAMKLTSLLVFPTIMLGVDAAFLFLNAAVVEKDILCEFNQNIDMINPTHKLDLTQNIATNSIKVWHYYNILRLFFKAFLQKMGILDCMWILSILNAFYISLKTLISSFNKYRSYNKLISKFNKIFRKSNSVPDQTCIICMTELLNCRKLIQCGHQFHYRCLFQWVQNKQECPVCRNPISIG